MAIKANVNRKFHPDLIRKLPSYPNPSNEHPVSVTLQCNQENGRQYNRVIDTLSGLAFHMIPLSRDEIRDGFILMSYDSAKHYYFSRGTLYYTWKLKDVKVATVILFSKKIVRPTF